MLYDEALYGLSVSNEVEFLPWRVWISIWTLIIGLLMAGFEGSIVANFFTNFTKEIFAALISTVFICESLTKTARFFTTNPVLPPEMYCSDSENVTDPADPEIPIRSEPNIAFLSLIIQFCTFWFAFNLRELKNGKYLGKTIRQNLANFAVPLTVVLMIGIDQAFPDVSTQKLRLPKGFNLTSPNQRSWFVTPLGTEQNIQIWVMTFNAFSLIFSYFILYTIIEGKITTTNSQNLIMPYIFYSNIKILILLIWFTNIEELE